MTLPSNSSMHGRGDPEHPRPLRLQAGPLALLFETESAFVRRICLGEHEVLRGIYVAVRDRNWGTVSPRVFDLKQDVHPNGFELSFAVECRAGKIHFRWNGRLSGAPDGTLRYTFDGEALTTFLKNRIGLCVLHPLRECCGAPARYERDDGNRGETRFPRLIEPQILGRSTFHDLRRLAHEVRPGCWAEVEFAGDLFETEDQRNWTDASFKTYCTPLALPFPVEIKAGTRLSQAITLRLNQHEGSPSLQAPAASVLSANQDEQTSGGLIEIPSEPTHFMPTLGLGIASHGIPLSSPEVDRLSLLQLNHLRADLRLADLGWPQMLTRAMTEAGRVGVALELAVHLGPDRSESALRECGAALKRAQIPVARVLAFGQSEPASSEATVQSARRFLGLGEVPIGGGSDAHFCELNREQALGRFGLANASFISWPMTPQVHVFDDLSIMENLEAQPHTSVTARAFAQDKPLVVSPITLRPRYSVAAGDDVLEPGDLPPQVDPRQLSLFNAAWTLGSIAALAGAQVASLTYFETTGWRGLMETQPPCSRLPLFPSRPGMVFPVYCLFAALAGFSRMAPVCQELSCRKKLALLCLFNTQGKRRVLCANLTAGQLPLALALGVERASLRTLHTDGLDASWSPIAQQRCSAGVLRLTLPPYGVASLDPA